MVKKDPQHLGESLPEPRTSPTYRGGVYAERQKFGRHPQELAQILRLQDADAHELAGIEVFGLDLTIGEMRAFDALQQLLDQTDYQGNEHGIDAWSEVYHGDYRLPRLSFTWSQYFAAYGLTPCNGKYQGGSRQRALEALKSLATTSRLIIFRRRREEGTGKRRKVVYDLIRQQGPIIRIVEGFRGLEEAAAARVMAGEDMSARTTRVLVQFGPLFVEGIETFFLRKSPTLYEEIAAFYGGRRFSPAVMLFCQWLRTWNRSPVQISKEKLAWALRLGRLVTDRKQSQLNRQLRECCRAAKAIGYLHDYEEMPREQLRLLLSPAILRTYGSPRGRRAMSAAADE